VSNQGGGPNTLPIWAVKLWIDGAPLVQFYRAHTKGEVRAQLKAATERLDGVEIRRVERTDDGN